MLGIRQKVGIGARKSCWPFDWSGLGGRYVGVHRVGVDAGRDLQRSV